MSGYMPTLLGSRLCLSGAAPAYPYIWRSSSRSAILVVWVVVGMWIKAVLAPVLREDSSFVGPCGETRAGTERQAHPSADEVVHGRLYRGAIKLSRLPIMRAAASSIIATPPLTLTQASTAASPLFLSGPPPSSPFYLANAAISCSSSSSTCSSQPPAAALPSDGYPETPRASSVATSAKRTGSSSATSIRSVSVRPARAK